MERRCLLDWSGEQLADIHMGRPICDPHDFLCDIVRCKCLDSFVDCGVRKMEPDI